MENFINPNPAVQEIKIISLGVHLGVHEGQGGSPEPWENTKTSWG